MAQSRKTLTRLVWAPIDKAVVAKLREIGWRVKTTLVVEDRTTMRFEASLSPWLVRAPDVAKLWDLCLKLKQATGRDGRHRRYLDKHKQPWSVGEFGYGPRKISTPADDPYPIAGMCPAKSVRGRYCTKTAGHEPPHEGRRGSTWLDVVVYRPTRPRR